MPALDGAVIGPLDVEIIYKTLLSTKTDVKTGATAKTGGGGAGSALAAGMRTNDTVTKIGPLFGLYLPELAMILGGQELL